MMKNNIYKLFITNLKYDLYLQNYIYNNFKINNYDIIYTVKIFIYY